MAFHFHYCEDSAKDSIVAIQKSLNSIESLESLKDSADSSIRSALLHKSLFINHKISHTKIKEKRYACGDNLAYHRI